MSRTVRLLLAMAACVAAVVCAVGAPAPVQGATAPRHACKKATAAAKAAARPVKRARPQTKAARRKLARAVARRRVVLRRALAAQRRACASTASSAPTVVTRPAGPLPTAVSAPAAGTTTGSGSVAPDTDAVIVPVTDAPAAQPTPEATASDVLDGTPAPDGTLAPEGTSNAPTTPTESGPCPLGSPAGCAAPGLLFSTNYDAAAAVRSSSPNQMAGIWYRTQVPNHGDAENGVREYDRLTIVAPPGSAEDPNRPRTDVLRAELRPWDDPSTPGTADGDVTNTGGYLANRAEVYDRIATRGTAATRWPDPIGSVRWYSFAVYVPADFQFGPSTRWLDVTQWKGLDTGSPPVALEIAGDRWRLGGKNASDKFAPIKRGQWSRFVIGMKFATTKAEGWVTVQLNGREYISQSPTQTMNTFVKDGRTVPDPNYLKQGIYRDRDWTVTHELFFGPLRIGTTPEAVAGA